CVRNGADRHGTRWTEWGEGAAGRGGRGAGAGRGEFGGVGHAGCVGRRRLGRRGPAARPDRFLADRPREGRPIGGGGPMSLSQSDFAFVSTLVRREASIVLAPGKEYLVEARLIPVARQVGAASVAEFLAHLQ